MACSVLIWKLIWEALVSSWALLLMENLLFDGESPIYVNIYVDNIIYFSASDAVDKQFEALLSKIGTVDFMGQVFFWELNLLGHIILMVMFMSIWHNNLLLKVFLIPWVLNLLVFPSFLLPIIRSLQLIQLYMNLYHLSMDRDALQLSY